MTLARQGWFWLGIVVAICVLVDVLDLDQAITPRRPLEAADGAWTRSGLAEIPEGQAIIEAQFQFVIDDAPVHGKDVNGTAFAVSADTWVTAAHVVQDCKSAYVRVWGRWRRMRSF